MKKILLLGSILIVLACFNCTDDENPDMACLVVAANGPDDDIIGKWKLVKTEKLSQIDPRTIDYSCDNITYYFQENGTLSIKRDREDYIGYPTGQHMFEFMHSEYNHKNYFLAIEGAQYSCIILNGGRTMDLEPLGGPLGISEFRAVHHFLRIQ